MYVCYSGTITLVKNCTENNSSGMNDSFFFPNANIQQQECKNSDVNVYPVSVNT
jgi:hypothetical protein